MRVKLQEGQTLVDEDGHQHSGDEPFEVPRTQFWLRRVADESVILLPAEKAAPKKKS
ncbi:MAG: DUF2635 domain-containing protein [Planctomycetota bacterium]